MTLSLLAAINETWHWTIPIAVAVEAVNPFGNVVVRCADNGCYRVVPEDLRAEALLAGGFAEAMKEAEFRQDWEMTALVEIARQRLGPSAPGRCYGFRIWPALNGEYTGENMVSRDLVEWLRASGDVAEQAAALPNGAKVQIKVT